MKENNKGKDLLKLLQDNYDIETAQDFYRLALGAFLVSFILIKMLLLVSFFLLL